VGYEAQRPNLKLKTRPKQRLPSLPLALALPDAMLNRVLAQCETSLGTVRPEHPCDPYAGLNDGKAILSQDGYFCASKCGKQGLDYNWCYLHSGWDYCDPESQPGKETLFY